jgi:hypothetical protein
MARPGGQEIFLTPTAQLYDVETGATLGYTSDVGFPTDLRGTTVSPDQAMLDDGGLVAMKRTALSGGPMVFSSGPVPMYGGCFTHDSAGVFMSASRSYAYGFQVVSTATGTVVWDDQGQAYPNNVACGWNGLVVGGMNAYYDPTDIWVFAESSGVRLASLSSAQRTSYRELLDYGLAISADGVRVVTAVRGESYLPYGPEVRFQNLPTPP